MTGDARRKELGAFLRTRRARLKPRDVGLAEGVGRRRTPGLRREEVAQISGVGLTWYTWLEQGRDIPMSRQVVEALVTALRLAPDDENHLYALAGLTEPRRTPPAEAVLGPLRRMLASLEPNPAYIIDEGFDVVAWNAAQAALWLDFGDVAPEERNLLWLMFTDLSVRELLHDWQAGARGLLGRMRAVAGRLPDDPGLARLADRIRARSPEFAEWWDSYLVAEFDIEVNRLHHPRVGYLELDLVHLHLVEVPSLTLVLQTPHAAADAERLARLATTVGAPGRA